jgi:hypothetical protein
MTTNYVNPLLNAVAMSPMTSQKSSNSSNGGGSSWFEALSQAWGQALDRQAAQIQQQGDVIAGGDDTPAAITELSTQSLKMSFLSNSSHTSISTVGQALETMARKQ